MPLTDVAIRNAKPGAKPIKLADARGLHLLVTPAGGKLWRMKYRVDGKEKRLSIGAYPENSLSDARKRRDKVRGRVEAENTFRIVAAEYCAIPNNLTLVDLYAFRPKNADQYIGASLGFRF
ncbi:MAG: Arm DNA-binding domain-containing protein [Novosphingobium sp.]